MIDIRFNSAKQGDIDESFGTTGTCKDQFVFGCAQKKRRWIS
jgi:hypothetical protein